VLFHDYLLAHSRVRPEAPAIVGGDIEWTHGQLAARVDELARALHAYGLRHGDVLVVQSRPRPQAVAVLIAAASLGVVFVAVSPDLPAARRRVIVDEVDAATVLVGPEPVTDADTEAAGGRPLGRLGDDGPPELPPPLRPAGEPRAPVGTDLLYVVFTSGSSGIPKGIMMSHRAVTAFWRGFAGFGVAPGVRLGSVAPLQFDFALLDLGMALGAGGCLVQIPSVLLQQPRGLVRYLARTGVTQLNGVPSLWSELLRADAAGLLRDTALSTVLYAGEAFGVSGLRALRAALPRLRLVNGFGHSESIACAYKVLPAPVPHVGGRVPFGTRAIAGLEMAVVDPAGEVLRDPYVPGELWLRGDALFDGYWRAPEATAVALGAGPAGSDPAAGPWFHSGDLVFRDTAGEHYFHSRLDNQVKVAGNRVELEEIDARLLAHPQVVLAAAVRVGGDRPRIVAVVRPAAGGDRARLPGELRELCGRSLPRYMVPHRIEVVDDVPLNANGKVDRQAVAARWLS